MAKQKSFLRDTISDLKNGLPPRRLATHFHARGIVFVHVPKCGGTSVENGLRKIFRLSRTTISPETSFSTAAKELGLAANDASRHEILTRASEIRRTLLHTDLETGYKCLTGHAPLGANTIDAWSTSHDFITVLRDPVERFCSHLAFNLNGGGGHGQISEPIDRFLTRPRAKVMGALYGKYFAGLAMDADFGSAEAIRSAKRTLDKMEAIGFTDALGLFGDDVTVLTERRVQIGHDNKTGPSAPKPDFQDHIMEQIRDLCAPDIEIYEWARHKFYTSVTGIE